MGNNFWALIFTACTFIFISYIIRLFLLIKDDEFETWKDIFFEYDGEPSGPTILVFVINIVVLIPHLYILYKALLEN